jgi:hypothetical protein
MAGIMIGDLFVLEISERTAAEKKKSEGERAAGRAVSW